MKNLILPFALSVFSLTAYSQAWMKGGNNPSASPFSLGSNSNDPIFFETFGINRTKLNGNIAYPINTFAGARNGFFLLGNDGNVVGGTLYSGNRGAFSLLHLNGNSNGIVNVQEFGYRNWMRTGITFTDNNDRAYIGYKANAPDESDFIINWSDNSVGGVGSAGPDNLLFNFTAGTGTNTNGIDGNQPNGREVVRMTGYGNVGIGPRFNNTQVPAGLGQGQPQSLLHLNNNEGWLVGCSFRTKLLGKELTTG